MVRSKRGRPPMCACGRGRLPLLLSASDREIPVFTGVDDALTVRRRSLAGVILGLPSPAFLRSPTPAAPEHSRRGACARAANGHGSLARQAWVLSERSTGTPAELGRGAGGVPGYGTF